MPEALARALETPGLGWLALAVTVAGVVRGFSGFGSAMIIMPVAGTVLSPVSAVLCVVISDLIGPLPTYPAALRAAERGDLARLGLGALLAMPLGVLALSRMPPEVFRWVVSVLVMVLLAMLVAGWRFRGRLTPPLVIGTGALGGALSGAVGVGGPPVIMLYMASTKPVAVVRANLTLFLVLIDLMMIALLALYGLFDPVPVIIALGLSLPFMAGSQLGSRAFARGGTGRYRGVAYAIILGSAVIGLPVWN